MSTGNIRRHSRIDVSSPLQIMWRDSSGNEKFTKAKTLDISESGMRIEVPEALAERSYVTMLSEKLALQGAASVRTCTRKGMKYIVGLEFSAGMRWKHKEPKQPVSSESPADLEAPESVPQ